MNREIGKCSRFFSNNNLVYYVWQTLQVIANFHFLQYFKVDLRCISWYPTFRIDNIN